MNRKQWRNCHHQHGDRCRFPKESHGFWTADHRLLWTIMGRLQKSPPKTGVLERSIVSGFLLRWCQMTIIFFWKIIGSRLTRDRNCEWTWIHLLVARPIFRSTTVVFVSSGCKISDGMRHLTFRKYLDTQETRKTKRKLLQFCHRQSQWQCNIDLRYLVLRVTIYIGQNGMLFGISSA